jgi:tetratricopeptide (TPR) repeat protein
MRKSTLVPVAIALALAVAAGCGKVNELKARKSFKDANALYQQQEYKKAAAKYEETLALDADIKIPCEGSDCSAAAHFYLANSYDNLYKPARQGEKDNDANLQKAIEHYKISAEKETNAKMKKLSLEYLVAAYGPDKLNDPSQAEPLVQKMIDMDPKEPTNYFALAKIYEDAGRYEEAESTLLKARESRPEVADVYMQLAGYYNRQGEFEKTIEALEQRATREPDNPEAYYTIATYYWDKAFRDFRLKDPQKKDFILKGVEASDKALKIKADYMEALTYKNLLLRLQANMEKDPAKQKALLAEADQLRNKAIELQKKKTAGVGD